MSTLNKGRLYMLSAALLWGLAGVCVKSITWGSLSLITARNFLSLLLLFSVKRNFRVKLTRKNIMAAAMMSITGILYVCAIKLTTAGTAIVLQYIAPILVFVYAVLFQHHRPKPAEVIITLCVFGGIVLSFADSLDPSHLLGNLLGLLSGISYAAQIIIMNDSSCSSDDALILSNILSFAVCLPFIFFDSGVSFTAENLIWILILGLVQYGLGNFCFSRGIDRIDKLEASLILTIEPIFNPIPVAIICGEKMGALALLGSAVVIAGVTFYGLLPTIEARRKFSINP